MTTNQNGDSKKEFQAYTTTLWNNGKKYRPAIVGMGAFISGLFLYSIASLKADLKATKLQTDKLLDQVQLRVNSPSCQQKLDEMDRMWDERRDVRRAKMFKEHDTHMFDLFEPEAVCFDDERLGGDVRFGAYGDGPKFMCGVNRLIEKVHKDDCLIYSVGSHNEIDFEEAVYKLMNAGKKHCEVHTFDPTIQPVRYTGKKYSAFHDWGFGRDGEEVVIELDEIFEFEEISLATAMTKLGHTGRTIDVFKIDCEGCEYTALTEAFEAVAAGQVKIDQAQVEMHISWEPHEFTDELIKLFDAADRANMRIFHKERNGWGCQGTTCVEYAFVSKDFLRLANSHYVC